VLLEKGKEVFENGKKFKQSAFFFSVNRRIMQKGKRQYKA